MKALTKTTSRTCRAEKVEGNEIFFRRFAPDICSPSPLSIRSGAIGVAYNLYNE